MQRVDSGSSVRSLRRRIAAWLDVYCSYRFICVVVSLDICKFVVSREVCCVACRLLSRDVCCRLLFVVWLDGCAQAPTDVCLTIGNPSEDDVKTPSFTSRVSELSARTSMSV